MQSLTSRSSNRRRFMRLAGNGRTALLAATALASAAGAATTPANAPIGATGSVASLSGSSMEVQNASSSQTTVNWTTTTTFSKTVTEGGQRARQRRLRHGERDALEEVQDDDRGATITVEYGERDRIVYLG